MWRAEKENVVPTGGRSPTEGPALRHTRQAPHREAGPSLRSGRQSKVVPTGGPFDFAQGRLRATEGPACNASRHPPEHRATHQEPRERRRKRDRDTRCHVQRSEPRPTALHQTDRLRTARRELTFTMRAPKGKGTTPVRRVSRSRAAAPTLRAQNARARQRRSRSRHTRSSTQRFFAHCSAII